MNLLRGSPHQRLKRCANALARRRGPCYGAYLCVAAVPALKSIGVSFPFPVLNRSKGHCHLRGRKNSESLTIGRVKRLWTADDSSICRIDICGDPDSLNQRKKPQKKNPGATVPDKVILAHLVGSVPLRTSPISFRSAYYYTVTY